MTNEEKRQLLDLQYLDGIFKDHNINTLLVEISEESPLSYLIAEFNALPEAQPSQVQLVYIPMDNTLDDTNLLQFFAYLSEEPAKEQQNIEAFLHYVNLRTPLGYFGATAEGGIFYRYIYALPRFEPPKQESFLDIFSIFSSTFLAFGTIILQVAAGELSPEVAKRHLHG